MIIQLRNHNTHHRGELAAMFAFMDVPRPKDEILKYFSKKGQRKE